MRDHTLGDVAQVVDCEHKTAPSAVAGEVYGYSIGTPNLVNGRIDYASAKPVSWATWNEWSKRAQLRAGDLILAREAPVGQVGYISVQYPVCLGQRTVLLRPKADIVDARYLHYRLLGPDAQEWMASRSAGSTVAHLNVADVRLVPMAGLPSLMAQRAIAGVLGRLDDLIDTNEGLGKAAGRLWRTAAQGAAEVERPLSALARFVNGRNFTKGASGQGLPVIRTPEVRLGPSSSTVRSEVHTSADHIASCGDILFVWSGSLLVDRWAYEPGLINQHIFKVIPAADVPDWSVLFGLESMMPTFLGMAADKATTMGHIQRAHLDLPVSQPSAARIASLGRVITPLYDTELQMRVENQGLRKTRDELLPLLLSGAISPAEVAA